jgi:hypothetical protein
MAQRTSWRNSFFLAQQNDGNLVDINSYLICCRRTWQRNSICFCALLLAFFFSPLRRQCTRFCRMGEQRAAGVKVEDEKSEAQARKAPQLIKLQDNYCAVPLTLYESHSPLTLPTSQFRYEKLATGKQRRRRTST